MVDACTCSPWCVVVCAACRWNAQGWQRWTHPSLTDTSSPPSLPQPLVAAVPHLSSLTLVRHAHHVPAHIGGLASLTRLLVDFGGDSGTLALPDRRALAGLCSLRVLHVHGSESLQGPPGAVAELRGFSGLADLRALQALELHNVCLADLTWLAVSFAFWKKRALRMHGRRAPMCLSHACLPQALTKLTRLNLAIRKALTPAEAAAEAAAAAPGYVHSGRIPHLCRV